MSESPPLDEARLLIAEAMVLLDRVFDALSDPRRWCKDAYARDAEGDEIKGTIVEAVESPAAASRCVFGELLHQGLACGYRIEIATATYAVGDVPVEVTHAPASWMLAAVSLATVSLNGEGDAAERRSPGAFVLHTTVDTDRNYEDAIWCVALAAEMLRGELEQSAPRRRR